MMVRDLVALKKKYPKLKTNRGTRPKHYSARSDFDEKAITGRSRSTDADVQSGIIYYNGRPSSSDYTMIHDVKPSVNEKDWLKTFTQIETKMKSDFDKHSMERYNPKDTTEKRISSIDLEVRKNSLKSWARLQKGIFSCRLEFDL